MTTTDRGDGSHDERLQDRSVERQWILDYLLTYLLTTVFFIGSISTVGLCITSPAAGDISTAVYTSPCAGAIVWRANCGRKTIGGGTMLDKRFVERTGLLKSSA